jgi:hypothetical protein
MTLRNPETLTRNQPSETERLDSQKREQLGEELNSDIRLKTFNQHGK